MYVKDALKTCCNIRYRIILTDINMPVMDGLQAAKLMREEYDKIVIDNPDLPALRIAAISAYNEQSMMEKCFEAGIEEFLTKPVVFGKIKNIFEQVFDQQFEQDDILNSHDI